MLVKPRRTPGPRSKPCDGLSTDHHGAPGCFNGSVHYMRAMGLRTGSGRFLWKLVPDPNATYDIIDGEEDYEVLASQYPNRWDDPSARVAAVAPDWNRIAVDSPIDSIHVTASAAGSSWLWGWDVESTLWMRWSFVGEPECVADIDERWELSRRRP